MKTPQQKENLLQEMREGRQESYSVAFDATTEEKYANFIDEQLELKDVSELAEATLVDQGYLQLTNNLWMNPDDNNTLWMNPDDNNTLYRFDGEQWTRDIEDFNTIQFTNTSPQPSNLVLYTLLGETIVNVSFETGEHTFGENFEPSEAARIFWESVSDTYRSMTESIDLLRQIRSILEVPEGGDLIAHATMLKRIAEAPEVREIEGKNKTWDPVNQEYVSSVGLEVHVQELKDNKTIDELHTEDSYNRAMKVLGD